MGTHDVFLNSMHGYQQINAMGGGGGSEVGGGVTLRWTGINYNLSLLMLYMR